MIDGVAEASILGVESALWSETTADRRCRRVPGLPAPRRDRRDRLVAGGGAGVGRLPPSPRRPRPALGRRSASTTSALPRFPGQRDRLVERTEAGAGEVAFRGVGRDGRGDGEVAAGARQRAAAGGRSRAAWTPRRRSVGSVVMPPSVASPSRIVTLAQPSGRPSPASRASRNPSPSTTAAALAKASLARRASPSSTSEARRRRRPARRRAVRHRRVR